MTPYERLMAEAIPDGTFGGAREPAATVRRKSPGGPALERPPDPNAAEHRRRLLAGLDEARKPPATARHLRAVPDTTCPGAAA